MPLNDSIKQIIDMDCDVSFLKGAKISLRYSILPKRCKITGRLLFLELAYRAVKTYKGPGTDVVEVRWYDRDEFLFYKIKYGF